MISTLFEQDISLLSDEQLWEHFEKCLIAHDWTYDFSDDHRVWIRGQEESSYLKGLRAKCEALDKQRSDELFFKHSFWHNDDGSPKTL